MRVWMTHAEPDRRRRALAFLILVAGAAVCTLAVGVKLPWSAVGGVLRVVGGGMLRKRTPSGRRCRLRTVGRSAECAALYQRALDIVGNGEWEEVPTNHQQCRRWRCTCQGLSDMYGTAHKNGWGTAPAHAAEWWVASACKTAPTRGARGDLTASASATAQSAVWRVRNHPSAAAAYARWTGAALAKCGGRRIVIYGSSFARALLWSTMHLFTGKRPTADVDTSIPSYCSTGCGTRTCMTESAYRGQDVSCSAAQWDGDLTVCHYPRDVGIDLRNCGWPFAKLWRYSTAAAHAATSPEARPLSELGALAADVGTLPRDSFEVVYAFKSWPATPVVDSAALRQFAVLNPDALVLESYVWGFTSTGLEGCTDVKRHGAASRVERSARSCEQEQERRFDALLAMVEEHLPARTAVIHVLETRGPVGGGGYTQRSAQVRDAVERLKEVQRRRHLFLDRGDVLAETPAHRRSEHGYYGDATDTWARIITQLACNDMRGIGGSPNATEMEAYHRDRK